MYRLSNLFARQSLRHFSSGNTNPRSLKGLIVGGGVGGLSAAITLRKVGVEALVFEAATAFERGGAGLVLTPNAVNACDRIGFSIGEQVRARGARIEEVQFWDFDGSRLSTHNFLEYENAFGAPSVGISRDVLHDILRNALKDACGTTSLDGIVHLNSRFVGPLKLEPMNEYPISAEFGRTRFSGDFLIGADGIHSTARRLMLVDEPPPQHAGWAMWCGIAQTNDKATDGKIVNMVGSGGGRVFLSVDIGNGRRYWGLSHSAEPEAYIVTKLQQEHRPPPANPLPWHKRAGRPEEPQPPPPTILHQASSTLPPELRTASHADRKAFLLRKLQQHTPQRALGVIAQTIEATDATQLLYLDVYDRSVPLNWSDGWIALLGDSAHATQPTSGQGAGLAIEDAEMLAEALCISGRYHSVSTALRVYEEYRAGRCEVIVNWGRRLGQLYTTENPLLLALRNFLIRRIPSRLALRQMSQIYGYTPPQLQLYSPLQASLESA